MQILTISSLICAGALTALAEDSLLTVPAANSIVISTPFINRLVEEARTNNPSLRAAQSRVKAAARRAGAVFVLDEVLTFRLGIGGRQGVLGFEPDLLDNSLSHPQRNRNGDSPGVIHFDAEPVRMREVSRISRIAKVIEDQAPRHRPLFASPSSAVSEQRQHRAGTG